MVSDPRFSSNSKLSHIHRRILLKYISRDEVVLFNRGTGGVVELREAIGQYEDHSPLYGFVLYRRRRVILKYVPEGTSRLLQGTCFTPNSHRYSSDDF